MRRGRSRGIERHGEAIYRFKDGMLPSDFLHRNVVLRNYQEDAIGIRHQRRQHDVGLGLSAQRVDVPQSQQILAELLAGVREDEQAKIAGGSTARVYKFDVARSGNQRSAKR